MKRTSIKMMLSLVIGFGMVSFSGSVAWAVADTSPPVLSEFDFTPKTVDVSTGAKDVVVTVRLTDATGVQTPTMLIDSDSTTQTAGFGSMTLISGTTQDGIWQRTATISTTAAPGSWTVTIYPLSDTVGNSDSTFHQHPTKLSVTNGEAGTSAPSAPTAVSAVGGSQQASVSWTAPSGSSITSYTVTSSPGGHTITVPGSQTTGTVTGLTNGTTYTFTVTATNALGTSPASAPSNAVTPTATTPGRVAKPTVKVDGRRAVIKWAAPGDGGSPLTEYRVTVNGRTRTTGPSVHKLVLRKLRLGRYSVKVAAVNAVGVGPDSDITSFRIRSS